LPIKIGEGSSRGRPLHPLKGGVSPLEYPFFCVCAEDSELREKYFQKKSHEGVLSLKVKNKFHQFFSKNQFYTCSSFSRILTTERIF